MMSLFSVKDSLTNKISYYHIMFLMASLPFDMFYSHLILISYAIHTLIHVKKSSFKGILNQRMLLLQSVFFITVLSTIYAINRNKAFDEWGKDIAILLVPILFWLNPLDIRKYKTQLLLSFSLVCAVTIIYLYLDALVTIRHYHLPMSILFSGVFTNHNFSQPIGMHATFFSMQLAVALVFILSVLIKAQGKYEKLFYLICCTILSAGILQLCSKSVCVALAIIINVAIPYFLLQGTERRRFRVISASIFALIAVGVLSSTTFRERYISELRDDLSGQRADETTDGRLARWGVVVDYISKKPLTGYGAGSEIGLLQEGFFNHKLYNSYLNRLNSHNQYLSFLLKAGIVGLLFYLATLAFGFRIAFRQKDLLFLTFLTTVALVSLSENLLDVDKGTFFYAFFFSFFAFSLGKPGSKIVTEALEIEIPKRKVQATNENKELIETD
jgi:O-antigen ligase